MKTKLARAARWLALIPALLPAGCHYAWTGPALWAHNSSAAFDAWLFLCLVSIAAPVWVAIWASRDA